MSRRGFRVEKLADGRLASTVEFSRGSATVIVAAPSWNRPFTGANPNM
jgi:hypothetical protein